MLHLVWSEMPRRSSRGHTYNTGAPQSRDALVAFTRVALVGFGGPVTHRRILHTAWGEDRGASARARVQLTGEPEDSSYHCCRCHGASCGWLRLKREFRCVPLDHVTRRRGDMALPSFWVAELKICTITHYQGAYLPSERLLGRPQLITSR